ncbi:sulfite exporter TauE/SafE family protein [Roseitranquillus sediminis]|uniref:sulfite exporter TauE/SafE family protein n=1 Tax=Roseitranquillus sediminis TaxID=2809051 RepID=UPI001D0C7640|nr:sulfite exporter TauE/SafE family protein [Roseitranquillus sediminis]MBM9594812.1 sulfite exporter TauE/SafE family protein [Roseitranquillus sediminis]
MEAGFYWFAVPAVLFAGISKGGFGSGAAFAASAILALVVDPGTALGVMLPMLMLMDVAALRPYWRRWRWRDARVLIAGSVPGVALGALLWRVADEDLIRLLIGLVALFFVAWQLARMRGLVRIRQVEAPGWLGLLAGLAAGFTSFVSHAGGPPVAVYLLAQGATKTAYQATTVLVFWAVNLLKVVPYALLGIFTAQTLAANLVLVPVALAGVWIGVRAHRLVPETLFFAITYALLSLTGAKLVWEALT